MFKTMSKNMSKILDEKALKTTKTCCMTQSYRELVGTFHFSLRKQTKKQKYFAASWKPSSNLQTFDFFFREPNVAR